MSEKGANKKFDIQAKTALIFIGLIAITSVLCLPLLYYAVKINTLVIDAGVINAVRITDYWKVAVGGILY